MVAKTRTRQPRCFLAYALAPSGMSASRANQEFNGFIADQGLPLAIFHDHFIGHPGGVAVFYVNSAEERDALLDGAHLSGWDLHIHPLIYSRNPAAFDEQIAFTLRAYRGEDWEILRDEQRPSYGDPRAEADRGEEQKAG